MNAEGIFVLLLFGAPAGILASLLGALGIWKRKPLAVVLSGIWTIPATYYLSAGFQFPLYLAAVFVFGAAYAVYKEKIRTAWLLLIPLFLCALWMTWFTLYALIYG